MTLLLKCAHCKEYTLDEKRCPYCGGEVYSPLPAKFSPQDKYGAYRREAKRKARQHQHD
ncbi:MAG: RNA-protein complex protein Nop10 [Candidatus Thorarchaeota archaeon]|nr:RNA-protein complex protein Nop10 [Candidatus Thorarchaeota archaeon]